LDLGIKGTIGLDYETSLVKKKIWNLWFGLGISFSVFIKKLL
jgi:hypothetical protein